MHSCTNDLRNKEVVNVCTGARLGYIIDVNFDVSNGRICSIVVPGECCGMLGMSRKDDVIIPWDNIEKIGDDLILVRLDSVGDCCQSRPKEKKRGLFF